MSYDFNRDDAHLSAIPNPFKFENWFLLIASAFLLGAGITVTMYAKDLFQAKSDVMAGITVGLALVLMGVAVKFLIQALSQIRFFFGRGFPNGLAGELPVTEAGVGNGAERILETMRHRAIEFPEPKGAINGILYSLVKDLITSPPQVQAAAVQHFHSLIAMLALFVSLIVSYFVFSGTAHEGVASWLYLPMTGLSLLTPFIQQEKMDLQAATAAAPATNAPVLKVVGLVVFSIIAPVVIPRFVPALAVAPMWIAPALLLGGSMIASGLFFGAVVSRLDSAARTSVSCEQSTIAMNCPPAQLWTAISRDFQSSWVHEIPNRAYVNVPPDVSEGERGVFAGHVLEETQPIATSSTQFTTWREAFAIPYARFLILLGAWGTVVAGICAATAVYVAQSFPSMGRMEISRAVLIVIALSIVSVLSFRIGHLLWSRMHFKSRLYWIETSGTYQTSQLSFGNQFTGHAQSSSTLTRIEDATLRVWVTDIVSVVFGKDGVRSIIAMAPADGVAKSLATRLIEFAATQSAVAVPTSANDIAKAQSIGALGACVERGSAASADAETALLAMFKQPQQERRVSDRRLGTCKFFDGVKGFGFVVDAHDRTEYFFNTNYVNGEIPDAGTRVEFDVMPAAKGPTARNIKVVS